MNILLISHGLDFTGAPIALLQMAKTLQRLGHEVSFMSLAEGPLRAAFVAANVKEVVRPRQTFDLYVANTVLSVPTALALSPSADKVVAWIHETQRFFDMTKLSAQQLMLRKLKFAAFPAQFQMAQFRQFMKATRMFLLRNCVPQFALPPATSSRPYFVVVGYWEENKNQVRILELMERCGDRTDIVFVGADRPPDLAGSTHRFAGQVPNDEARALIARSRGLLSVSLAETQSIAVIEAALSGRPVVAGDIAGFRELQTLIPDIILFDLDDAESFSCALSSLDALSKDEPARDRLRTQASRHFGEEAFAQALESLIDAVTSTSSQGGLRRASRRVCDMARRVNASVAKLSNRALRRS